MAQWLRQSTAVAIMFGPFVDKADGVTLKTDATTVSDIDNATTGIFLSKAGEPSAVRHQGVTTSVVDAYGMMHVHLDTTDTATLGQLDVLFAKAATYLPVWKSFMVVPQQVWDSYFGADLLDVSMAQCNGGAVPSGAIPNAVAGANGGVFIAGTNAATVVTTSLTTTFTGNLTGTLGDTRIAKLDATVSSRSTLGSGAITWIYNLTDSVTHLPIADASIWISTDLAGTNIIASGITDAFGNVTFYLDAGTVYVWAQKSGWNFTNPDTEVVS